MKIKELKINGFGKLVNKEIKLNENINIIYGKNEAGKSTLLKFIIGMFYGLSKNKNGQSIPDIERFEPWNSEEFSGKILYELDNKEQFDIYRDFRKKNPKIFNKNMEDISKEFNIDKTKGNQFFYDQTGLEEEIFTTSMISKQGEVKLDEKSQNNIIQKISNILGTGEDTSSYVKIVSKLRKKLNDEIGTNNTKEKPINIIDKRIEEIEKESEELKKYQNYQFEIEEMVKDKKLEIIDKKERFETLKTVNIQLDKVRAEESKINVIKKLIENSNEQIKNLKETKENNNMQKVEIKKAYKIIEVLLILVSILSIIFLKKYIIKLIPTLIAIIFSLYLLILSNRNKIKIKEYKKEYKNKLRELENNKRIQEEELSILQSDYNKEITTICNKYDIKNIDNISEEISELQSKINELALELHTIELDYNNIVPKLEKYVNFEEELENLKEDKKELELKREEIRRVLEVLEIAYAKMKEEITPKFTNKLSNIIYKISNGRYKKVCINVNGEIVVEQENGEYINAENLSMGTIDQLYLSLRLATIEEITKEKMPIILDEAFAYYDNERLENILKYLSEEYMDRQIIIFTCTEREKEVLNNLKNAYNLIEL